MSEARTIEWASIAGWVADNEQQIRDVMRFEGLRGAMVEVLRLAPEQPELAALREELADGLAVNKTLNTQCDDLQQRLAAAEQRNAELKQQLDSIDKHLRGNVNDPNPLPPIMPGAFSYTTTYGLVAGLRRERDYLNKSATPLPAGDDYLRQLAQRLREYVGNPHHINPLSEAFKRLIDDSAFALSKLAALKPTESGASE